MTLTRSEGQSWNRFFSVTQQIQTTYELWIVFETEEPREPLKLKERMRNGVQFESKRVSPSYGMKAQRKKERERERDHGRKRKRNGRRREREIMNESGREMEEGTSCDKLSLSLFPS